jgi:hypothetical protein
MSDHALSDSFVATIPALPALAYARALGALDEPVRYGYSCDHRLDIGPCQMRSDSVHVFPFDGDENRCRACVRGVCIQRVELWPEGFVVVVHDCRPELS